jgi:hypothetical protein
MSIQSCRNMLQRAEFPESEHKARDNFTAARAAGLGTCWLFSPGA